MKKTALILSLIITASAFASCQPSKPSSPSESTASEATLDTPDSPSTKDSAAQTTAGTESETETEAKTETEAEGAETAAASWFDDAVFTGDSVTMGLNYYSDTDPEILGKAKFVCSGGLSYHNAQWELDDENNVHPTYKGKTVLAETCAKITGANKVFIMLGMNDIGIFGVDDSIDSCKSFVGRIKKNSPDADIYIQSVTPIMRGHELEYLNNAMIREFNEKLKAYCEDSGIKFLDVYHALCDGEGYLPAEYCGDPEEDGQGIHFVFAATEAWVSYLKNNVLR